MAVTSGPRWRRRSGRTEVGECPKQSPPALALHPYTYIRIYRARLCQQLGCRNGWIIRQPLTSTSETKKRFFFFAHLPQPRKCTSSILALGFVSWPCFNAKAEFKVTSEVGDMGMGRRSVRLD